MATNFEKYFGTPEIVANTQMRRVGLCAYENIEKYDPTPAHKCRSCRFNEITCCALRAKPEVALEWLQEKADD